MNPVITLDDTLIESNNTELKNDTITGPCDSCDSRAMYEATKDGLRLTFCGHHVRRNAASLTDRGFVIKPDTYTLS
jgi:hypothetical protein